MFPTLISNIMKSIFKSIVLVFLFLGCTESDPPNTPTPPIEDIQLEFTKIGEFPASGRSGAFSFTIGNKIYIGTGFGSNASGQAYLGDFWEYDIISKSWTEKASFPLGPFIGGDAVVYNGKGYVFFGGTLNCPELYVPCEHISYTAVHAYDPTSDTWEKVADLSGYPTVSSGFATLEGDQALFVWDKKTIEINMLDFQFVQKPEPPASITSSAQFRIGNKVYFACGLESGKGTKATYSYDVTSGLWEKLSDFPGIKRYGSVGFSFGGFGYIVGGKESDFFGEDQQFKEIWQFNPSDKSWKKMTDYPGLAFTGKVLEVVGNDVFLGFGGNRNSITFEKDWWMLKLK